MKTKIKYKHEQTKQTFTHALGLVRLDLQRQTNKRTERIFELK